MSVVRIESKDGRTRGWQARAHVSPDRYLSRFFADQKHRDSGRAYVLAERAERRLKAEAKRIRAASK